MVIIGLLRPRVLALAVAVTHLARGWLPPSAVGRRASLLQHDVRMHAGRYAAVLRLNGRVLESFREARLSAKELVLLGVVQGLHVHHWRNYRHHFDDGVAHGAPQAASLARLLVDGLQIAVAARAMDGPAERARFRRLGLLIIELAQVGFSEGPHGVGDLGAAEKAAVSDGADGRNPAVLALALLVVLVD